MVPAVLEPATGAFAVGQQPLPPRSCLQIFGRHLSVPCYDFPVTGKLGLFESAHSL